MILYSPSVSSRDSTLCQNAYENSIDVYHANAANPLTQKLGISSGFNSCEGSESQFFLPRIRLVKGDKVLDNEFPLQYQLDKYIRVIKGQSTEQFED